jgi:hypothetical protein
MALITGLWAFKKEFFAPFLVNAASTFVFFSI